MSDATSPEATWELIRALLRKAAVDDRAVVLPGDDTLPFEGALVADATTLSTVDYGQARVLRRTESERDTMTAVLDYVLDELPAPVALGRDEIERMLAWAAPHLFDLAQRAQQGLVIDVPQGLLLDRLGAIDGFHLYPSGTSFEARSLPPTALDQPLHEFVTESSIRMRVAVTPPWFGRAGGGLRFTIADPGIGIRDLLRRGVLRRIEKADA